MRLYQVKIRPQAAWATPWQADSLFGMLCGTAALCWGAARLREAILEPALAGEPPFVLSDAFPGDMLPIPSVLRQRDWGEAERKAVKRARWLRPAAFRAIQEGRQIAAEELLPDEAFLSVSRLRNLLSRVTDTTGEDSLFAGAETFLNTKWTDLEARPYLSVYARVSEGFEEPLLELFGRLADRGFGADTTTGLGAFAPPGALEPVEGLEAPPAGANGVVVLSTFQPAADDPTEGFWEAFVKYGKVGPEWGLENVFKRPLVLLRPGACFFVEFSRPFLGRTLPMEVFLEEAVCREIARRGMSLVHGAFGLTVPCVLHQGE